MLRAYSIHAAFCLVLCALVCISCMCERSNAESFFGHAIDEKSASFLSDINLRITPLLATRFNTMESLREKVRIEYSNKKCLHDSTECGQSEVYLEYTSGGQTIRRWFRSGVNQGDLLKHKEADLLTKARFVVRHPRLVRFRRELEKVHILSRRRADLFGSLDAAFYHFAETSFRNITTPATAFANFRDSGEKGYLNTFNHITAQAIITAFFSEDLAELIGDLHERLNMPELSTGRFSAQQLQDSLNNPMDNYVDIINNEIGQQLGKQLKRKYGIHSFTICDAGLLTMLLNEIQSYYMRTLGIGLNTFCSSDELIIKFSNKLNKLRALD